MNIENLTFLLNRRHRIDYVSKQFYYNLACMDLGEKSVQHSSHRPEEQELPEDSSRDKAFTNPSRPPSLVRDDF